MAKLNNVLEEWKTDCKINELNVSGEIIRTASLHAKYLSYYNEFKLGIFKSSSDYEKMKRIRIEYYQGSLDKETLDEHQWEPFNLKLNTKMAVDSFITADKILLKLIEKKLYYEQAAETCQSILKEINNRTWQLKTLVDYQKYLSGN